MGSLDMMPYKVQCLLKKEIVDLQKKYRYLELVKSDRFYISGNLQFNAIFDQKSYRDSYGIHIYISDNYPSVVPVSREIEGKIPSDFHKYKTLGFLCLGAPLAVNYTFFKNPTLFNFVENLLVPYLFSYTFFKSNGILPYGQLEHGYAGLFHFYCDAFAFKDPVGVLGLLKILSDHSYDGNIACPCNSGQPLCKCHGVIILEMKKYQSQVDFIDDFKGICKYLTKGDYQIFPNQDVALGKYNIPTITSKVFFK